MTTFQRSDFSPPPFTEPLDAAAHLAAAPPHIWTRGMFLVDVLDLCRERGLPLPTSERFVGFKAYPVRRYEELLVDAAKILYPEATLREGLRRIGQRAYPKFAASLAGRVLFGALGNNFNAVLRLASKAYEIATNQGPVKIVEMGERHAVIHLREMYAFLDCLHVGTFEGAMLACRQSGSVLFKRVSDIEGYFWIEW